MANGKAKSGAGVSDIRVSFIGKDSQGKSKHVALHVHGVEKALAKLAEDESLASVAADIKSLASVGSDLIEKYDDAHKVEISKAGFQDGSTAYPFKAAAEAD